VYFLKHRPGPEESELYDGKYAAGYRSDLGGYEIARKEAIQHFFDKVVSIADPARVLDYGAGRGLHIPLWTEVFPRSELSLCDVSAVAIERCLEAYPDMSGRYRIIQDNRAGFEDSTFDVIVSVEVMEHVADLSAYLSDIHRLLRPGGVFVFTTPCGNRLSIEHVYSFVTGKIDSTQEGYRRWSWEDPTHLRRMRSGEMRHQLLSAGFSGAEFRFRSHLFSFLCTYCPPREKFRRTRNRLMTLDYRLFRRLPNGASILGVAKKR
jgi:SAM-dependent methyltransferase